MSESVSKAAQIQTRTWDGKQSVEHQLEIHITDLVQFSGNSSEVRDILGGLQYVLDYRIKNHPEAKAGEGDVPFDGDLADRLLRSLLLFTGERKSRRNILGRDVRPSENANWAFHLLVNFCCLVGACREALLKMDPTQLKYRLRLYHRIVKSTDDKIKATAVRLLRMLQGKASVPWTEYLEEEEEIDLVADILASALVSEPRPARDTQTALPLFPPSSLYFDRDPRRVLDMFGTTLEGGLTPNSVIQRRAFYGENRLPAPQKTAHWKLLLRQFADLLIIILLLTAIVSLVVDWPRIESAIVLILVVLLNVLVGFWQEVRSARTVAAMKSLHVPMARIRRHQEVPVNVAYEANINLDGASTVTTTLVQDIPATELVPGDIVELQEGDIVPADLRILKVSRLEVDESMLTGESRPVSKGIKAIRVPSRRLPIGRCSGNAFMGTMVLRGTALGLVVRVGAHTEIGKISVALASESSSHGHLATGITNNRISSINGNITSPLRRRLSKLAQILVLGAVGLCGVVVLVGIIRGGYSATELIRLAISLAVSVIPEGLVAILTVAISLAIHRLAQHYAVARRSNVVENLGAISVVASDKTGTITEGRMRMLGFWFISSAGEGGALDRLLNDSNCQQGVGKEYKTDLPKLGEVPSHASTLSFLPTTASRTMEALNNIILCNNSTLEGTGDPTEVALLRGALDMGMDVTNDKLNHHRLLEIPFDSERRMMSIVVQDVEIETNIIKRTNVANSGLPKLSVGNRRAQVYAKGAVEAILPICQDYLADEIDLNNKPVLNDTILKQVARAMDVFADQGLRVMALAYRRDVDLELITEAEQAAEESSPDFPKWAAQIEREMTFIGLVGLTDPPREGVALSVALCRAAGIKVCMVTGDHLRTAIAIARQVGIYSPTEETSTLLLEPGLLHRDNNSRSRVLHGRDLDILDVNSLANLQPFPSVFARVSPTNKLMIVQALQRRQEIVAMTGDGVNDAPAIKEADVGVAMGQSGTEITRDAADLILLNDNFSVLVEAIVQGRLMFHNVTLFIIYLLSCNSAEIWTVLGAVIAGWPTPLTPLAILWANIIADIPPSMCLAWEVVSNERLMRRNPKEVSAQVLGSPTWILVMVNGLLLATITLVCYRWEEGKTSLEGRRSEAFLVLIGLQIVMALFSRSPTHSLVKVGLLGNLWLVIAVLISLGLLMGGLYVPWLARRLELQPVVPEAWIRFAVGLIVLLLGNELVKFGLRQRNKGSSEF